MALLLIRVCHAANARRIIASSTDAEQLFNTISLTGAAGAREGAPVVEHWIPVGQIEELWLDTRWHGKLLECKYRNSNVPDQAKRFWAIVHPDSVGRLLRIMAESK